MYQAIFFKEWIKTRRIVLLLGLIFAALITYFFISTAQMFRVNGAVSIIENIILKDVVLISDFKYLPILAAILLALSQYVPEMNNKRLKLTLHLPMSESSIISSMLIYGLIVLILLFCSAYLALLAGLSHYYPFEITTASVWVSIPWFIGGLTAYLLTAWICIEPVWKQRIVGSLVGICGLSFFFMQGRSGAYITFLPYLLLFFIVGFLFPFYSATRFKNGAQ